MGPRVLIVDDVVDMRFLLKSSLSLRGFDVVGETHDAATAEAMAMAMRPDGVVIDLHMPGSDSMEAIRRMREALPEARILAVSATPADADLGAVAVAAGADAFFDKAEGVSNLTRCFAALFGTGDGSLGTPSPRQADGAS
ncbi:MAG: response regulator transcription factor [Acidimicrobiales bacterium]|nr:response regulator transcription factor [Acidimicrobiales bacterium]